MYRVRVIPGVIDLVTHTLLVPQQLKLQCSYVNQRVTYTLTLHLPMS